jgi:hypothetical protein
MHNSLHFLEFYLFFTFMLPMHFVTYLANVMDIMVISSSFFLLFLNQKKKIYVNILGAYVLRIDGSFADGLVFSSLLFINFF